MVLTCGESAIGRAVHDHQHTRLFSRQKCFQEHKTIGFDGEFDEGFGFISIRGDHHPLPARQHVSLDHPRVACKIIQSRLNVAASIKPLVGGGRHTGFSHRLFGVKFGALQMGEGCYRTKARNSHGLTRICKTFAKRSLWADHNKVCLKFNHEVNHGINLHAQSVIGRQLSGSCVSRNAVNRFHFGRGIQRETQSVLPPTAADHDHRCAIHILRGYPTLNKAFASQRWRTKREERLSTLGM